MFLAFSAVRTGDIIMAISFMLRFFSMAFLNSLGLVNFLCSLVCVAMFVLKNTQPFIQTTKTNNGSYKTYSSFIRKNEGVSQCFKLLFRAAGAHSQVSHLPSPIMQLYETIQLYAGVQVRPVRAEPQRVPAHIKPGTYRYSDTRYSDTGLS